MSNATENTFAAACYNDNSIAELIESLALPQADETDCDNWDITPDEWWASIASALAWLILDRDGPQPYIVVYDGQAMVAYDRAALSDVTEQSLCDMSGDEYSHWRAGVPPVNIGAELASDTMRIFCQELVCEGDAEYWRVA